VRLTLLPAPACEKTRVRFSRIPIYSDDFKRDLDEWLSSPPGLLERVQRLVEASLRHPLQGLGKPERLKHHGPNVYARRITQKDRLVYEVHRDRVVFLGARGHY